MAGQKASALPRMIRGSVVTQRRRCGKANCHCADGVALHESTVLSYSADGRSRTLMLEAGQVAAVRAAVARYRVALGRTEQAGNAGLQVLLTRRVNTRRGR